MRKEDKKVLIESLTQQLKENNNFYLTDVSTLNAEATSNLRRLSFKNNIRLMIVKNTLLKKAMENVDRDFSDLYVALKGQTAIMFSESGNAPAKMIKDYRKKTTIPLIKAAFIEETAYIGDDQIDFLIAIKSKNELVAELIALLQSPAKNVISALQSGGQKLSGILETLSERDN
jgi:large subunit ribosomal protein L10